MYGITFLPVDAYIKQKLFLLSKYGLSAIYVVVVRNVGTQEINLKAVSCTNKFAKQSGRQQPNCCTACFELHQKKIRFTLFKKMIPYDEAKDALHSTEISSIQMTAVQSFLRINDKFHDAEGLEIKRRILHFQTAITSNLSKHIVRLSGDSKTVPGLDLLISNFSDLSSTETRLGLVSVAMWAQRCITNSLTCAGLERLAVVHQLQEHRSWIA
jgi:hypothetical protein